MKFSTLLKLYAKSFCRQQFFYSNLSIYSLYVAIAAITLIYIFKTRDLIINIFSLLLPKQITVNESIVLLLFFASLLLIDFVIKYILKRNKFPFRELILIRKSYKYTGMFYVLKELLSAWNLYFTILISVFIINNPQISNTALIIIIIYLLQLFASQSVYYLNRCRNSLLFFVFIVVFLLIILYKISMSAIANPDYYLNFAALISVLLLINVVLFRINIRKSKYLFESNKGVPAGGSRFKLPYSIMNISYITLNMKMNFRSPLLRRINVMALLLTLLYIYILLYKTELTSILPNKLVILSIMFSLYPVFTNQYLFSAESSFFDILLLRPNFNQYLISIYQKNIFISIIFLIPLLAVNLNIYMLFELISIYLYCIGPFLLSSFCIIFLPKSGLELFKGGKLITVPTVQSFFTILSYLIFLGIVVLISILISKTAALLFMFITGSISLIYANHWLRLILKVFKFNKYKFLDIFRNI